MGSGRAAHELFPARLFATETTYAITETAEMPL